MKGNFGSIKVTFNEGEYGGDFGSDRIMRSFFIQKQSETTNVSIETKCETQFIEFIDDLLDELKYVFREQDIEIIEHTRILTDWSGLAARMRERSQPIVYSLEKANFT